MTGIYEILNTANQKRYVGSAVIFSKRWKEHRNDLRRGGHHSLALQRAWNKYGEAAFKFLPILTCAKSMLLYYEQQLLDKVKPEYNICKTAGSSLGLKHTAESLAKMSAAQKGRTHTAETRAKMVAAHTGKKFSPEHRARIGASKAGKPGHPHSAEFRARLSERNKGNTYANGNTNALGFKHTAETRARVSAAQTGRVLPPEWRANISAGNKGKVMSLEARKKLSLAALGRKNPAVAESNRRRRGEVRGAK